MADDRGQQVGAQAGQQAGKGDEFALRTRETNWTGGKVTMHEPPLAEGVQLADQYFDVLMETVNGQNVMRLRIRESEYVATVCSRYFSPAIDATKIPLRLYREVRAMIDEWEEFSGMGALRETMRSQLSETE